MKLNNANTEQIEIPLDRTKILLMLYGSVCFVLIGFWMFFHQTNNSLYAQVLAIVTMLFFGLILLLCLQKLFSSKKGLIINNQGITDNSNGMSIGLIEWKDIIGINVVEVKNIKSIVIIVNNPEYYLAKANFFKAKMMRANMKFYNSPLFITDQILKVDFELLYNLLLDELSKHQS